MSKRTPNKRVVAYLRVSDPSQVEKHSLAAQKVDIERWCSRRGGELVQVYSEEGKSAYTERIERRPVLMALLQDAKAGKFDIVVVHTIDRWSRNVGVQRQALQMLGDAKGGFVSVTEDFDFTTPSGKLMLTMIGGVAEFFSDQLGVHVAKAQRYRASIGLPLGPVPFGYRTPEAGGVSHPDQAESVAVRRAFEGRASGGFPIAESVIGYEESNSFAHAFLVGILNSIMVALLGVLSATLLGTLIGVSRLSSNWLARKIAEVYIEIFRNVPLLLQLFFWYFVVFQRLPLVQDSIAWPGPVYFSNRGIFLPWPELAAGIQVWIFTILAGVLLGFILYAVLRRIQVNTGRSTYPVLGFLAATILAGILGWIIAPQPPLVIEIPTLDRFNFRGGLRVTPEFAALLLGLVIYTASFIAEIVRSGIQSVQKSQIESAKALGLGNLSTLRFVVFPQALRVIIPPMINQYLNLTKNSSLAIAIGYPELFFVGRTIINQAGRAIPVFLIIMAIYLTMSLLFSLFGTLYNRRVSLGQR